MNWLFICSRNKLRSPTAEAVFSEYPGIETDSAGLSSDAEVVLEADQVAWADLIFVMEPIHRTRLKMRFGSSLANKRVVVLGIPDRFAFMEQKLIERLETTCRKFLP